MRNSLESIHNKKIERIKDLLLIPSEERKEKMLLELMSFTRDFKLFENISMSIEHQYICKSMTLEQFKPNEVIVRQGDPGDSFFYILSGIVKIVASKKLDIGLDNENSQITVEKYIGDLKPGDTFGELSLLHGTPRSATIVSVTNSSLIKIDKVSFDSYVKDIFESQLQDQIEFMKICPIFHRVDKNMLIKLAIRTERKKYRTGQVILQPDEKADHIYIIRRGNVIVSKKIKFLKDEKKVKNGINIKRNKIFHKNSSYEDLQLANEKKAELFIEKLSIGPNEEDIKQGNYETKEIILESLKMGDIFPSYSCINNMFLDVAFQAENPCDLITLRLGDIQETNPETFQFIQKYAKPYPGDEFLRRFYYYSTAWTNYKSTLRYNIIADRVNGEVIQKNKMRSPIIARKDMNHVTLPEIFSTKKVQFK